VILLLFINPFSYEDFVEGIKPKLDEGETEVAFLKSKMEFSETLHQSQLIKKQVCHFVMRSIEEMLYYFEINHFD
jgi:hypothetical protein